MAFSDSSWQDCPDTGRTIGAYIIFYQGGKIYHGTHVSVPVTKSSADSDYNISCTAKMNLADFRILINEFLNKGPDIVTEESPLIILDIRSSVCMAKNGKDTKHTMHIERRVNFVRNGENYKMKNIYCC